MRENIAVGLSEFQDVVSKLGRNVSQAGYLWSDQKFLELSQSIRTIANQSVRVLEIGDELMGDIDRFQEIAEEQY